MRDNSLNSAERTLAPAEVTSLDLAVAHAYGCADYTPTMPDDEILKRLLALNLERATF